VTNDHAELKEFKQAPNWFQNAACRGVDTNIFFPERGDSATFRLAVQICDSCQVAMECLQYALENNERSGVWGGTNGDGRRPNKIDRTMERLRQRRGIVEGEQIVDVAFVRNRRKRQSS